MSQPNIVLITTDQQSGNAMSCAGNPYLHTPSMDRLAEHGVRFDNAYSSYPLCVPARMSLFTGRMPHEMGIFVNSGEADEPCAVPLVAPSLNAAGYNCHYVGKWHLTVPEHQNEEHGFENVIFGGGYGGLDKDKAAEAIKFIEDDHDTPFFLVVSFNNPHDCCELSRGQELRMENLPEEPPEKDSPPLPPNFETSADAPDILRNFQLENPNIGCAIHWDEMQTRRYRWGYNRLVEMVDKEIGKVLEALENNNLFGNTLIIFTSDHGDGQGAHQWNQKWCMYDEVSRVPFIVSAPGQSTQGRSDRRLVSAMLDVVPTVCDYAGVLPPAGIHGQSVRPFLETPATEDPRPFVASECSFGTWAPLYEDKWPKARMIRTSKFKYIAYASEDSFSEQLFDMETNPYEMQNLALDPDCSDILQEQRAHLRNWCHQTADSFFT